MNLYFLSGLGADKRVFQKLRLPEQYNVHHVGWLPPDADESLQNYAGRLLLQVNTADPFILIGLSFGGIVAIEMSKCSQPVQTVLVSSISGPAELSAGMIRAGKWKLQRFIPPSLLLKPSRLLFRLFGARSEEEKQMLRDILADTDPVFFRWALNRMTSWDNHWKPTRLLHIHGTADRILPYRENMQAKKVIGGGHLMVYSHAAIVSTLLAENLRMP